MATYTPTPTNPTDLGVNAFSDVGGSIMTQQLVSLYDIYKPSEWIYAMDRHSLYPNFATFLKAFGFRAGKQTPTTGHYEHPWTRSTFTVASIVTAPAGAGDDMVVQLDSASMYDAGATIGGASRQASFPVEGDVGLTHTRKAFRVSGKDTTTVPANHRLTLTPVDASVNLDTLVVATGTYSIVSTAFPEGSPSPAGRMPRIFKYLNDFQIVKETCGATGTELTNQTWFQPIPGQTGAYFLKARKDAYERYETWKSGALLYSTQADNVSVNVADLGFDVDVKMTEGFTNFADTYANLDTYTVGSYDITDFDNAGNLLEDQRPGTREYLTFDGRDIWVERENVIKDMLTNDLTDHLVKKWMDPGKIRDDLQPTSNTDFALAIGYKGVKKGGFTWTFCMLHDFNDIQGGGAAGYNYTNWSIMVPHGWIKEQRSGDMRGYVGYEYKAQGNYSREDVIADIAGAGVAGTGTPYRMASNDSDYLKVVFLSECAFHGACANKMVLQRPT